MDGQVHLKMTVLSLKVNTFKQTKHTKKVFKLNVFLTMIYKKFLINYN